MSLLVYPFVSNSITGEMIGFDEKPNTPFNDSLDFESWRLTGWGSKTLQKLDCLLLFSLKTTNIYTENVDLDEPQKELDSIKKKLLRFTSELSLEPIALEFRTGNALQTSFICYGPKKHNNFRMNLTSGIFIMIFSTFYFLHSCP